MKESESIFVCSNCDHEVQESDEFCPNCGSLFIDDVTCSNHPKTEAEGVCIICVMPYCKQCGSWVGGKFLCAQHEDYEIYEGMARVYGVSDEALAQYAANELERAGLHPFIYSRKSSPLSIGGSSYTLFRASGEFDGHIINELKVMVPCQEVIEAEKILAKIIDQK